MTRETVLITGGSRGVGYALAAAWARRGARVIVTGRDAERLHRAVATLADLHGPRAELIAFAGDLADARVRAELAAFVRERTESLHVFVNNAAVQVEYDVVHGDPTALAAEVEREIAVNLVAPAALVMLLLPALRAGAAGRGHAAVVNVTSGLALAPKAAAPIYCATKAGLRTFGIALRWQLERAAPGVRVVEAMLPLVDTDMTAGRGRDKLAPADVAEAILRGVDAGRPFLPIGKVRVLRALQRVAPGFAERLLRHA